MKRISSIFFVLILSLFISACTAKTITYVVNFDSDGGTFIEAVSVNEGDKVSKPKDPEKDGYEFKEWQINGQTYDFSSPVNGNLTLKAVYESGTNTVIVIVEGRRYTIDFKDGEKISIDNPESAEGKNFVGWLVDGKMGDLSEAKNGSTIEAVFEDVYIRCTGVYTPYNSYYAVEGTGAWKLDVTVSPSDTNDKIYYSSDDESVVRIDSDGYIYAQKPGKTKIRIKCGDMSKVIDFETRAKSVAVTTVNVSPSVIIMYVGDTTQLSSTVAPDNATDKTLTYVSYDTSVATVNENGLVTGKRPGLAKIGVKAHNDVIAYCDVCIEGEFVIFSMQNNVSVKAGSGEKIPYTATHVSCWDWQYNTMDVTQWVDFHTAYTSALDIDGYGNVYAKGAVYETVDIPVYFTYNDGSSFTATSDTYTVHVEK